MSRPFPILLAVLLLPLSSAAMAQSSDIRIEAPWARASIGTSRPGVAYMSLRNAGEEAVTVQDVRSAVAGHPEIHASRTDADGVVSMVPADDIEIAPGETVTLEPGGRHVMLMDLQQPLVEGETFDLTVTFTDGEEVTTEVQVRGISASGPGE